LQADAVLEAAIVPTILSLAEAAVRVEVVRGQVNGESVKIPHEIHH